LTLILAAAVAAAPANPAPPPTVEPDVTGMSPRDIKAFNMTVPANHPFHIRCQRQVDTGSLVKGTTTCKTNRQWAIVEQRGNDDAR
ncbi:hypothetical protein ABTN50_19840, partial [Acinetobacter baumannii]